MDRKVACIGNMNHFLFNIGRYLADRNFIVELFLLDEDDHFKPSADIYYNDVRITITQTNWSNHYFFDPQLPQIILRDLDGHNFFIGCDWSPAYLSLVNKKLNIMVPYGSDIFYYPFYKIKDWLNLNSFKFFIKNFRQPPAIAKASYQRQGIEGTALFILDYLNPYYENSFKKVRIRKRLYSTIPMFYIEECSPVKIRLDCLELLKEKKNNGTLLFYSSSRLSWTSKKFVDDYKANDLVIEALKQLKNSGFDNFLFVTHEYGKDVDATKLLVKNYDLSEHVIWLPLMHRKEIKQFLPLIDIGVGEFGYSFYTYGAVLEMIANRIPIILNYKSSFQGSSYFVGHSSFHAETSNEIFDAIKFIIANPAYAKAAAEFSYQWYNTEVVGRVCKSIEDVYSKRMDI